MSSLLIRAWEAITFKGDGLGIVENAAIYVEDGEIVAVGHDEDVLRYANKKDYYFDLRNKGLILPGFIDAHMHTQLAIIRGYCQDVPEYEWMHKTVAPLMKHAKNEHILAGSRLAVLEALKTGTTTFGDYGNNMEIITEEIYLKNGLRAAITETINSIPVTLNKLSDDELYPLDYDIGYKKFQKNITLYRKYELNPLINVMLGPQALDMNPLELIKEVYDYASKNNLMIHMHVAQGGRERRQILRRYGDTTIKVLYRNNLLNERLLAAHCHDSTDEELELMARLGVRMVSCQRSISLIDGIIPPLVKYIGYGGTAALGTDQASGNNNQSIFMELKFVSILSKILLRDPSAMPAWKTLRLATIEGAKALGLGDSIGSLEKGKKGDIIAIDLNKYNLSPISRYPIRNYIYNLVYSSQGNEVTHVFINGEPKVVNGEAIIFNEYKIIEEANKYCQDLLDKAGIDYLEAGSKLTKYINI